MEKTTRFGFWELVFVITNSIIAKLFLLFPSRFYDIASSSSLLMALYVALIGFIVFYFTEKLYRKFEGRDILSITMQYLGKFTAGLFSLLIIIMLLTAAGVLMRTWAESIKISIMPRSPILYILLFFLVGMYIAAHIGIKSIIRMHSIILPVIFVFIAMLFVGNIPNFDLNNLFPVLGNGNTMFLTCALLVSYLADVVVLTLLLPFAKEGVTYKKVSFTAYGISTAVMVLIVATHLLTVQYQLNDGFSLPVYRLAQYIDYGNNIAHLESVFSIAWFLSFLLNAALYLYLSSLLLGRMLKLKSIRPVLIPFTLVILVLALVARNTENLSFLLDMQSLYRLAIGLLLPIILLGVANIKLKRSGK